MPSLKQAALLAYEHLKNSLAPYRYYPIPGTIGLQEYESRPTKFYLYIDDFGIKFQSKEDDNHLCNAISTNFRYTIDHEGKNYYSLIINQQYKLGYVNIEMPNYAPETLKKMIHVPEVSL